MLNKIIYLLGNHGNGCEINGSWWMLALGSHSLVASCQKGKRKKIRDGPLMIWGGLWQRIRVEFFFPPQLAVELFFSWASSRWVFFPAFARAPPPKSLMVLPLVCPKSSFTLLFTLMFNPHYFRRKMRPFSRKISLFFGGCCWTENCWRN